MCGKIAGVGVGALLATMTVAEREPWPLEDLNMVIVGLHPLGYVTDADRVAAQYQGPRRAPHGVLC